MATARYPRPAPTEKFRTNSAKSAASDFIPGCFDPEVVSAFVAECLRVDPASPNGVLVDFMQNLPLVDPTRVTVPTLMMWHASSRSRQLATPFQRFRRHWLFWLQLLCLLLLALALGRLSLNSPKMPGKSLVLILDHLDGKPRIRPDLVALVLRKPIAPHLLSAVSAVQLKVCEGRAAENCSDNHIVLKVALQVFVGLADKDVLLYVCGTNHGIQTEVRGLRTGPRGRRRGCA